MPEPIERLVTYPDLVGFTETSGLIAAAQARRLRRLSGTAPTQTVRRARKLREDFFSALSALRNRDAIPAAALRTITTAIQKAHAARALSVSRGPSLVRYDWISPHGVDVPLHACALAIEDLLTGAHRGRVRKCRAADCAVYFIDRSKAGRRHWCSMQNCGNRAKQRRWRGGE